MTNETEIDYDFESEPCECVAMCFSTYEGNMAYGPFPTRGHAHDWAQSNKHLWDAYDVLPINKPEEMKQ